ncbi:MAG: hypothetical protein ACKV19_10755, partial [Verrucomicrobiales bacterium]
MNLLITQRPAAPWWLAAIISAGLALGASIAQAETGAAPSGADELSALARLEGGEYRPLYAKAAEKRLVKPFWLGRTQVTNGEFLDFVRAHPQWRRSQVARSQADANYLNHWAG